MNRNKRSKLEIRETKWMQKQRNEDKSSKMEARGGEKETKWRLKKKIRRKPKRQLEKRKTKEKEQHEGKIPIERNKQSKKL